MADAQTLTAALTRLATELRDIRSPLPTFDYCPTVESAPPLFVYVCADGVQIEPEYWRVPMRLVAAGGVGVEQAQRDFVAAIDTIETELKDASLGDTATAGWSGDIGAWVCTWIVEIPRAYA